MWSVYILKTQSGKFYTGVTENLERRMEEHRRGKGGHYSKYDRPTALVHSERCENRQQAEKREQQIKRWSRAKKLALAMGDKEELKRLSRSRD